MSGQNELLSLLMKQANTKDSATVQIDRTGINPVVSLINEYGNMRIIRNRTGFVIIIGEYKFKVTTHLHFAQIYQVSSHSSKNEPLDEPNCELMAHLAELLFFQSTLPINISAEQTRTERKLWQQLVNIKAKVKATSTPQQLRFNQWEQGKNLDLKRASDEPDTLKKDLSKQPSPFAFTGSKPKTTEQIKTYLYIQSNRINPLLELIEIDQEMSILRHLNGIQFHIDGYIVIASLIGDLCSLSLLNISLLGLGAAELLAKVTRALNRHSSKEIHVALDQAEKNADFEQILVKDLERFKQQVKLTKTQEKRIYFRRNRKLITGFLENTSDDPTDLMP